jgi:hypothetical protein
VRKYSNVIKLDKERAAETLGETFQNMGGVEKLLLLGVAGFMLAKSSKVRWLVGGLTALYFGQKFLMKQDDPLNESWAPLLRKVTKKAQDGARGPLASIGIKYDNEKYDDAEMQSRIDIATRFLSDNAREQMNTSVTGFSLLGDMKLPDLAQNF